MQDSNSITAAEAARQLGVSRAVVYRMIHSGALPAFRELGRSQLMVNVADLEKAAEPVPVAVTVIDDMDSVSVTQARAMLHTRPSVIRDLIRSGELKTVRVANGRERVLTSSLRAYMTGGADFIGDDEQVAS